MSNTLTTKILANPKPILILDTCIYFDFFRDVVDNSSTEDKRKASIKLFHSLIQSINCNQFYLVVPDMVKKEFEKNKNCFDQIKDEVKAVQTRWNIFQSARNLQDPDQSILCNKVDASRTLQDFIEIEKKIESLLSQAYEIKSNDKDHVNASKRIFSQLRPAQKAKDSHGDCLIYETLLRFSKELRNKNYANNIFFVSSNIKDYAANDKITIHHEIDDSFSKFQIIYAPKIEHVFWKYLRSDLECKD